MTIYEQLLCRAPTCAAVILFCLGLLNLLLQSNLIKKIIGMNIMDSAVFLFLTSLGADARRGPAIITDPSQPASLSQMVNPLPAGLVLTGIVVSVSMTAFLLALTLRVYRVYHSLDLDEILSHMRKGDD